MYTLCPLNDSSWQISWWVTEESVDVSRVKGHGIDGMNKYFIIIDTQLSHEDSSHNLVRRLPIHLHIL